MNPPVPSTAETVRDDGQPPGVALRSWHAGADAEAPNAARIYDYLLGGSHNFAADRQVAEAAAHAVPDLAEQARANRAFLRRAVHHLATTAGIRQFLDIGSGIPTVGNVHDVARRDAPDARIVYVDNDPTAVAHGRLLLAGDPRVRVLHEDLRSPQRILQHPDLHSFLDLHEPVAVLFIAVLHFIADADRPGQILAQVREALAPSSYLVISHGVSDKRPADAQALTTEWTRTSTPLTLRSRAEVRALFAGLDLLDPGIVWAPEWRPDRPVLPSTAQRSANLVGVGRIR